MCIFFVCLLRSFLCAGCTESFFDETEAIDLSHLINKEGFECVESWFEMISGRRDLVHPVGETVIC
jgi:hypothetical protein